MIACKSVRHFLPLSLPRSIWIFTWLLLPSSGEFDLIEQINKPPFTGNWIIQLFEVSKFSATLANRLQLTVWALCAELDSIHLNDSFARNINYDVEKIHCEVPFWKPCPLRHKHKSSYSCCKQRGIAQREPVAEGGQITLQKVSKMTQQYTQTSRDKTFRLL